MMLAYHNDVKIKEDILKQLQAHYEADEIVKGYYWENGKGCALGCTLHSCNHKEYEERFGIPVQLAYLEDRIFEGLPNDLAKQWPLRFMRAIKVGIDISKVWAKFTIWLLSDQNYGVIKYAQDNKTREVIQDVIDLYQKSLIEPVDENEFICAASKALKYSYYGYGTKAAWAASLAKINANYTIYVSSYAAINVARTALPIVSNYFNFNEHCESYENAKQKHFIGQSNILIEILKYTFNNV